MPLRLDVRKKLSSRSDRVKCVDLHPTEEWMLAALYNGNVHIWNYETQVRTLISRAEFDTISCIVAETDRHRQTIV